MENILEHGPMYAEEDYSRALQLLANSYSGGKGEGSADREEIDKKLEQQLQQLSSIFSGDTV